MMRSTCSSCNSGLGEARDDRPGFTLPASVTAISDTLANQKWYVVAAVAALATVVISGLGGRRR